MESVSLQTNISTNVKIVDKNTGEVLVNKCNAIHNRNMALAIARGLANESNHQIFKMAFGNGGTYVEAGTSGGFQYHYNSPNIIDPAADLYNKTYEEVIDDQEVTSNGNQVVTSTGTIDNTFLVICTCTLAANEPSGQSTTDGADDGGSSSSPTEELYSFDELGLKTNDNTTEGGLLLSHLIFNPIEKTANRELVITYTLTVSVV